MWRSLTCPSTFRNLFSGLRVSTHGKQVAPYSVRFLLTSQKGGVGPILPRVPHGGAGYVRSKSNSNFDNRRGARRNWGSFCRSSSSRGSQKSFSPKAAKNKKMNHVGTDGRTLTCKCCGSFRHLVANCPDTWENQPKVNVTEDEHVVLFTGYNKDKNCQVVRGCT